MGPSIKEHYQQAHQHIISRQEITQNFRKKNLEKVSGRKRLRIKESLLILQQSPSINKQHEGFEGVFLLRPHIQGGEPIQYSQTTPYTLADPPTTYSDVLITPHLRIHTHKAILTYKVLLSYTSNISSNIDSYQYYYNFHIKLYQLTVLLLAK